MGNLEFSGKIGPSVAVALLESLREVDTPEDEASLDEVDLPLTLRRRLGLSSVVEDQIRRYARLRDGRDALDAEEVARLFALIGRRTDASHVFAGAGVRLADRLLDGHRWRPRVAARLLPRSARERLVLRSARRLAGRISPEGSVRTERRPPVLIVRRCLPAQAVGGSQGCQLVSGAFGQILEHYGAGGFRVVHEACEGASDDHCSWRLESVTA